VGTLWAHRVLSQPGMWSCCTPATPAEMHGHKQQLASKTPTQIIVTLQPLTVAPSVDTMGLHVLCAGCRARYCGSRA
jgi:hypothetical protein